MRVSKHERGSNCGITNNIDKRFAAHNSAEVVKYTSGRAPLNLVYQEESEDKSAALMRERAIKALPRVKRLVLCGL
jgi:putative endonuclease